MCLVSTVMDQLTSSFCILLVPFFNVLVTSLIPPLRFLFRRRGQCLLVSHSILPERSQHPLCLPSVRWTGHGHQHFRPPAPQSFPQPQRFPEQHLSEPYQLEL